MNIADAKNEPGFKIPNINWKKIALAVLVVALLVTILAAVEMDPCIYMEWLLRNYRTPGGLYRVPMKEIKKDGNLQYTVDFLVNRCGFTTAPRLFQGDKVLYSPEFNAGNP